MASIREMATAIRQHLGRQTRPDTRERAAAQVQDRYRDYPSNGLTPRKLAQIFREADEGDVLAQMELFEEIEEKDPHLFAQLQTRKNAVTGLEYEVLACSAEQRDKEIAEFVTETLAGIENLEDVLFDLMDAIGKGIAVSEILWEYQDGRVVIGEIRSRHQKRLLWDGEDQLRITTQEEPAGLLLPPNKFVIHQYKARSGHPARAGVLRVCAWMYLFKNYDVKDWVTFAEVFGMPIRIGKYNPGASEEDKAALMQALVSLGSDAAGILPEGTDIEIKEGQKTTSIDLYERLARYCDEQISKAILGQTLTSDSGGGSFAQSKTHNEVRHDLTVADCKALASTIKRDLIRPLVLFNFGSDVGIPTIKFDCQEPEDLQAESMVLDTLVNKLGLKVPAQHVYSKFGVPQPEDGQAVLPGQAALQPAGRMPPTLPFKTLALKGERAAESQAEIDKLVERSIELSQPLFAKMFAPIRAAVDEADDLQELADKLEDPVFVGKLMADMEIEDFEELLQRAMMAADLQGRVIERE